MLDSNILALMNDTVLWERSTQGVDEGDLHGDLHFYPAVTKSCWVEEAGAEGGFQRKIKNDFRMDVPQVNIYFDASDVDVQAFTLADRFTVNELAITMPQQPSRINTFYGPAGDAWLTVVTL